MISIARLFPQSQIRNIRIFYLLTFLSESYFIVGNWIFFWLKYMTYGQLGILDMVAFAFGFVMEVPTGAIADKIGRRKSIMTALFCTGAGFTTIATSSTQPQLVIGFLIAQIGWAFYSGASEALAYDTLKENGKEKEFPEVISTVHMLGLFASIMGAFVGGYLYSVMFRLPHLFTGLAFFGGFIVSLFLKEPTIDSDTFSVSGYIHQMKQGFRQLLLPSIWPFIPLIVVTSGVAFMYGAGIIQPAIGQRFGFDGVQLSIIGGVGIIFAAIAVRAIPWMRTHLSDRQGLQALASILMVCMALAALPLGYAGFAVMMLVTVTRNITFPWISVVVNRELPSQYRATTLSAIEMIKKVPYILTAVISGILIEKNMLPQLCLAISGTIALILLSNALIRRHSAIKHTL